MLQVRQDMLAIGVLGFILLASAPGQAALAAPAPESQRSKDGKEKPGDDAKKDDVKNDGGKQTDSKKPATGQIPPFPLNIDMMLKNLPPGAMEPAQIERMKKDFQKIREQYQKMMAEMNKKLPNGFPGGIPGGIPGGFPGGIPGIPPGALPPGGIPGIPGMGGFGPAMMMQQLAVEGRLGARIEKPSDVLIDQLDLPRKQGLVIREVKSKSAAAKAGLKANDILLEINGKSVPDDLNVLLKQLAEVKADATVDAVVLRKGKRETIKGIVLPEFKFPGVVPPRPTGVPGLVPPPPPRGQFPRLFNGMPWRAWDSVWLKRML
ncbi:MAG: PDZ domain-containing protein [Planctomycetes bacterium]|nr:PDZ domain-containing protein [Planctomycetota bacterium]